MQRRVSILLMVLVSFFALFFIVSKVGSNNVANESEYISGCLSGKNLKDGSKKFYLKSGKSKRSYIVHLPRFFEPGKKYPVILAFTGKTMKINYLEKTSQLSKLPAIVVYPQSMPDRNGVLSWQGAPYSPKNIDDIQFVNDILDTIVKSPCVDSQRIYSVGISNGGGMSWLLSCNLSSRIAAFAMVAGAYYAPETACKPKRPAAILSIHGEHDRTVPVSGSLKKKLPPIKAWIERRAKQNGCLPSSKNTIVMSPGVTVTEWSTCKDNATVRAVYLRGSGHYWPKYIKIFSQSENPLYYRQTPNEINISTAQFIYNDLIEHSL